MARTPRVSHAAGYLAKGVKVYVTVRRDVSTTGHPRFFACANLRRHGESRRRNEGRTAPGPGFVCRPGRNPRRAVAAALRAFARNVADRRGAFAGFQGYSKLHRRRRRIRRSMKRY